MEEVQTLTFNDILDAENLQAVEPITEAFDAKGKKFKVTISRECLTDAEAFYRAGELAAKFQGDEAKKVQPMKVAFMPGKGEPFTLTAPLYIGALHLLSLLAIEPKFSPDQWAMAGKKFGPQFISKVAGWAAKENGLVDPAKVDATSDPKE